MARRARQFMNGVNLYRHHPARRTVDEAPVIWQSGTTVVRDYTAQAAPRAPVVLAVPSLINRYTVLDIHPRHSFLRMLAAAGFRVLTVDWGDPSEAEQKFTLGDYVTRRLIPALNAVSPDAPAHIVGYCMGGLLALALAQARPGQTRSLSLLATPWDFHAGFAAAGQAGQSIEDKLRPWLDADTPVPVDVVQGVFAAMQPMQAFRKFSSFAARDQSGFEAECFVLTEDWLNDGVALAAPAARECFGDLCGRNAAAAGNWRVGGEVIDPHKITAPVYAVVPGRDRIVPPESAMPLARLFPHAVRHEPMLGHIGIMASLAAPHQVWKPLAQWLAAH
ncbi:MAG: alpha/beta hydrolase [Alphaproteobacteria bacterium]|nr:alpha/beta hydrolase [Alphaproteobacteria bacterium]